VAISKVNEEEAAKTFEYLQEIGEIDELVAHSQIDRQGGNELFDIA
jgi:hydrogenase expression/formation protein HypC